MATLPSFQPMPVKRVREPFDHPDWIFELKYDGYRALAYVGEKSAKLVSRNGNAFRRFGDLAEALRWELTHEVVVDGEVVCLDHDGRPMFNELLFGRGEPCFVAFDVLWLNGNDLRERPLEERKRILGHLVPKGSSRIIVAERLERRGCDLFDAIRKADLEGIVAKWKQAPYRPLPQPTWLKVKNPDYSQARDRYELFDRQRSGRRAAIPSVVSKKSF